MSKSTQAACRRWPRFSLRFLLILIVLIALPLAWKVNQVHDQRRVVAEVTRIKGRIYYDYQSYYFFAPRVKSSNGPAGPQWLRRLLGDDFFADVVSVQLSYECTDDTLRQIATLRNLKALDIHSFQVSDQGVAYLASLQALEHLSISSLQMTGAGLEQLAGLRKLKTLSIAARFINDTQLEKIAMLKQLDSLHISGAQGITDDVLAQVARLDNLREFSFTGVQFTDAGIAHLCRMANLRSLSFRGSSVTVDGATRFHQALPKCTLTWNP